MRKVGSYSSVLSSTVTCWLISNTSILISFKDAFLVKNQGIISIKNENSHPKSRNITFTFHLNCESVSDNECCGQPNKEQQGDIQTTDRFGITSKNCNESDIGPDEQSSEPNRFKWVNLNELFENETEDFENVTSEAMLWAYKIFTKGKKPLHSLLLCVF